eukprot:TRINITY_DN10813_c0_g2_i1.p1 TRINITY_DN10813_c0_g2~~TRINITY_DN10813_c0_g2_i1.p1  ORF type:complete len:405 (+),score=99.41 TRINITY_DN10813_c0_g2_i1:108-1217(+)
MRTAKSIPGRELLRLLEEHAMACEKYVKTLQPAWERMRILAANLRSDLRGAGFKNQNTSTSGIFGDILSTLGVTMDTDQTPDIGQGLCSDLAEQDLSKALEHFELQPARALKDFQRVETEVKDMLRVLHRLRAGWPDLISSVQHALSSRGQLKTKDLSQALKQSLQFRGKLPNIMHSAEALCDLLEDATDQVRHCEEERLRFKAMTKEILDGQSKALAARTVAVLWLRQLEKTGSSTSKSEPTRFDIEQASEALERNLEAAKDMEERLVNGISFVMRTEANHTVVQRVAKKLSTLRSRIRAATEAVTAGRVDLTAANRCSQASLTEAAAKALVELMAAFDAAAAHVDAGGGRGGSTHPEVRDPREQAPS